MTLPSKQQLRAQILKSRAEKNDLKHLDSVELFSNHDWAKIISGTKIGCFASLPDEPDTFDLRKQLATSGCQVLLPILKADNSLLWALDVPPYELNKFGIEEPALTGQNLVSETSALTTVIIPALGVDRSGNRLGRGGGFYDRTFAALPTFAQGGPLRIVLVFDSEIFDELPAEPHDCPIDLIVTPSQIIEIPS